MDMATVVATATGMAPATMLLGRLLCSPGLTTAVATTVMVATGAAMAATAVAAVVGTTVAVVAAGGASRP
ncbi:hypothetical protein GO988_19915 [Hymenobacter sp. HMF4947]|uniref:Uncharacterized protein n=1 Tax=Hymenobacter ginkgonis TaxID=2682976 RepID=A0A7K1TJN2_9BACT|nr:hypothetical protein [Hymenobacter ginkgonis]MVN78605.1 hypothetical protein [Hymenobacter ginkgonis]